MSVYSSYAWREHLLPGPASSSGYRTVLLVGTTGAGKTTLVRQLIGTDPGHEPFPATATFKTTTTETEVLCAPGEYYAVAVFSERDRVRLEIAECVTAAVTALADRRPAEVVRDALAAHADERLRLEYVLGPQWLDATVPIVTELVAGVRAALPDADAATVVDAATRDPGFTTLIEHLLTQVAIRFSTLRHGQLLHDDDPTWPRCWRLSAEDRAGFLAALRRLAGNERGSYGTLLSPLVDALRVRGPLHPTWAAEIPYLMVVDTEGLGHVPASAATLPLGVLEALPRADRVILVDDATHPMQAAPLAALRQLATSGHVGKLAVCFTHADDLRGPNVADDGDRRALLRRAINQALGSLGPDLDEASRERLRQQLDDHTFVVGGLHRRLDPREADDAGAVTELRRLLSWLRAGSVAIDLEGVRPVYRLGDLRSGLRKAVDGANERVVARLAASHWRQVQTLCQRIGESEAAGHGELQPAAELAAAALTAIRAFVQKPVRWAGVTPSDEQHLELVDQFLQQVGPAVVDAALAASVERVRPAWRSAGRLRGRDAASRRLAAIEAEVLATLVAPPGEGPSFLGDVVDAVRSTGQRLGFEIADTVAPGFGTGRDDGDRGAAGGLGPLPQFGRVLGTR